MIRVGALLGAAGVANLIFRAVIRFMYKACLPHEDELGSPGTGYATVKIGYCRMSCTQYCYL